MNSKLIGTVIQLGWDDNWMYIVYLPFLDELILTDLYLNSYCQQNIWKFSQWRVQGVIYVNRFKSLTMAYLSYWISKLGLKSLIWRSEGFLRFKGPTKAQKDSHFGYRRSEGFKSRFKGIHMSSVRHCTVVQKGSRGFFNCNRVHHWVRQVNCWPDIS